MKMVDPPGIEPRPSDPESEALPLCKGSMKLVRHRGVEPLCNWFVASGTSDIPMPYKMVRLEGFEPPIREEQDP